MHAKFQLDPSNRLATIQQRYRQTDSCPIAYGEPFHKRSPNNGSRDIIAGFVILSRGRIYYLRPRDNIKKFSMSLRTPVPLLLYQDAQTEQQ